MKRNDVVTAAQLQPGDRFYKASDKAKLVLVKVAQKTKQTQYRTYKHFYCEGFVMDHSTLSAEHKERNYKAINADTEVVFLRHSN